MRGAFFVAMTMITLDAVLLQNLSVSHSLDSSPSRGAFGKKFNFANIADAPELISTTSSISHQSGLQVDFLREKTFTSAR